MPIFIKPELVDIYVSGIRIHEPITTLTDFFITATCWYIFFALKTYHEKALVFRLFRYFFFMMGLATLLGGIFGHAFSYIAGHELKLPGWICSMIAVMLAERSAIIHSGPLKKRSLSRFFSVVNIVELAVFIIVVCFTFNFLFVEIHAFYGLLIVFGSFELFVYLKTRDQGSKWMLYSVGISALAALVHIFYFSIHKWFNYLDLAHCLMCVSALFLYRGVTKTTFYEFNIKLRPDKNKFSSGKPVKN